MGRPTYDKEELEMAATIAANVRAWRLAAKLSQPVLARLAGLAPTTISKIETSTRKIPTMATLSKLSEVFGRPIDHFKMVAPPPAPEFVGEEGFRTKISPRVDGDLREKAHEFMQELNREHLRRLREEKKGSDS